MPQYVNARSRYDEHPAFTEFFIDGNEDGEPDDGQPFWLVKEDDGVTIGVKGVAAVKVGVDGTITITPATGKKINFSGGESQNLVVENVDALPADARRGRLVLYNGKLYYYDGATWKEVATV